MPNADPKVVAVDSRLSDTTTEQELSTFQGSRAGYPNIRKPVFEVNGQFDRIFCGPDKVCNETDEQTEELLFPNACFDASVPIGRTGHDQNLHYSVRQTYEKVIRFANLAVGNNGQNVRKYQASCERGPGGTTP